jgi:hypothetical protein
MAPTLVRDPFHRDGWVYEEKVDGWRILAYKDGERVRLVSRNGRDHTRRFADLAAAVAKLSARTFVLDGEVAIYDQQLRSRFDCCAVAGPRERARPGRLHRHRENAADGSRGARRRTPALRVTTLAETAREVTNAPTTR